MKFLYISCNKSPIELTSLELKVIYDAVVPELSPLVADADFKIKKEIDKDTMGQIDLVDLSKETFNAAYSLMLKADLHPEIKKEIKKAFEEDVRFNALEITAK